MIILENVYIADESKTETAGIWYRETYPRDGSVEILYDLLAEREEHQNISHQELPPYEKHALFVEGDPYKAWYLIIAQLAPASGEVVGTVYLTHENEIGIQLFKNHTGKGYGEQAISEIMNRFEGPFYANINPENEGSIRFFQKFNAKHIQNTYKIEGESHENLIRHARNTDIQLN